MTGNALEQLLIEQIAAAGPLRFSEYVDEALYNPTYGFYATHGRAGRRGDFITSPEVGPLFGACIARYLDAVWVELGQPAEFVVVEGGAGPGTLARSILAAEPDCGAALRYIAVETSAHQRADHPAGIESVASLPSGPFHVVLANELLDNLPFEIAERTETGWSDVWVAQSEGVFVEQLAPMSPVPDWLPTEAPVGARVPLVRTAVQWCTDAAAQIEGGRMLLFDYASPTDAIVADPDGDWIRTYRNNERGGKPLDAPGSQDITAQIPIEQIRLVRGDALTTITQAEFLVQHGIEGLVEEGRAIWQERAHLGDLAAMKARSRISESESLIDMTGLGAFVAFEWAIAGFSPGGPKP